jgi:anti-sigma factor RsiW
MPDCRQPDCQEIDPLVTPFIDGELPDADRVAVAAHLCVCPPCHSRVTAEQAVHELIHTRRAAFCTVAPEPLRARCAEIARLNAADAASRRVPASPAAATDRSAAASRALAPPQTSAHFLAPRSWTTRLAPFALAASLVVVVGGAFLYQATESSARVLAAELTADHVKCFAMNSALRTHQMPAAVESSMASAFNWRMHLPDEPARAGLELVGSRPCLYAEGKIAHIMYRHHGHPVSLFMLPKTARAQQLVKVLGHEAAIWCVGSRTFVLIAREPRDDVERMASFVQASLH